MNDPHALVQIANGAWAVRNLAVGEVMHPGVGPAAEAQALYVEQSQLATRLAASSPLVLFDVGLGAGSNAFAARAVAEARSDGRLELHSFERDVAAFELALQNPDALQISRAAAASARTLLTTGACDSLRTTWRLHRGELPSVLTAANARANVVYWDPFSPKANPDLWTIAAFEALRAVAAEDCVVYTYSSSTRVRLAMMLAGWHVGVGTSIGQKFETTAAAVNARDLTAPLDDAWLAKRAAPTTPWPLDLEGTPAEALARLMARH